MSDMEWEDTGPVLLRASRLRCSATATGNDMSGLEDNAKHVGNCSRLKGGREMEKAGTDQHDDSILQTFSILVVHLVSFAVQ